MKHTTHSVALLGACCLGLFGSGVSGKAQNFYFNANAGPALADDVRLREFLVPLRGVDVELDPGVRVNVAWGYNFNEYISAGLETGFIYNKVDEVNGAGSFDASLSHVPLLAQFLVRYDKPDCNWIPYGGVAAGGDASTLSLDHVRAPNGSLVDGDDTDVVFAWQLFAGLRYRLNPTMSIGGGYKFYSASGATWDVSRAAGDIETGTARVHSVGVDFTLTF